MIYCFVCQKYVPECRGHLTPPPEFLAIPQTVIQKWGRLLWDDANRRSPFTEMVGRMSDEDLAKIGLERISRPLHTQTP